MNNLSKMHCLQKKLPHSPNIKNKMQGKATFETVNKYAKYVLPSGNSMFFYQLLLKAGGCKFK